MNNKRILQFDIAKAYLIGLVILGHVFNVLNPAYDKKILMAADSFINTFHMSAFFLLHGVLCNTEKWRKESSGRYIYKRFMSLVVPYIFFELIGICWHFIFQKQTVTEGLINLLLVRCNVGADWFLIAMFIGTLLFLIYLKHPNKLYGWGSAVLGLVLTAAVGNVNTFLMDSSLACVAPVVSQALRVIGRGLLGYAFIMLGCLCRDFFKDERLKKPMWIFIAFLVTAFCAVVNMKFGGNDYYECVVHNPITLLLGGVSGTMMVMGIAGQGKDEKFIGTPGNNMGHSMTGTARRWVTDGLAVIGRHTLTIMGTHQLAIYALTAIIPGFYGGSLWRGLILILGILLFELPVVFLIDRYLPFMVGRNS